MAKAMTMINEVNIIYLITMMNVYIYSDNNDILCTSITLTQSHVRRQLLFTSAFKFFLTPIYPSVAYHIKVLVLNSKWSFSSNTHVSSDKEPCQQKCMSIQPLFMQHPLGPAKGDERSASIKRSIR